MRHFHIPWPYTCKDGENPWNVSVSKRPLGLGRNQGWSLWADDALIDDAPLMHPHEGGDQFLIIDVIGGSVLWSQKHMKA